MRNNDWNLFCKIAGEEPYKEHTILQTPDKLGDNPAYYSSVYGSEVPGDVKGRVICTSRDEEDRLIVTKMRANTHQMVYGASGSCKTQGAVLGELANIDGRTSYIVFDTKAEVTPLVYSKAVKLYGKEKVVELIDNAIGTNVTFDTCAKTADQVLFLREKINRLIAAKITK